tara:strand:- start:30 stop:1112 length:1083 start_codon:yes stop_codon:yes gene_type:complete
MDTEEEKGFFERVYGPTIESLKDPETYTRLLDPSSYGDLYQREAEGLESLYNFLGGPDRESLAQTYGTYGDTKSEIFTNPDFYGDQIKFLGNTGYDLGQFYGGLGKGMLERIGNIDFYNPFTEEGARRNTLIPGVDLPDFMTPYGRYAMDAGITGFLGAPSFIKDNPLAAEDSYLMDSMEQNASMQAGKYANDMLTDDVYSNFANESYAELPYEEWIKTNRNTNPEKYDDQIDEIFQNKVNNFFNENFQPVFQQSVNDQMMNRFGINMDDQIFSEEGGLRSLNENYRTQYDASEGRPRFDYETVFPQAYYDLSDMAEVPLDIASTAGIVKYAPKLLNISAKQFRKQPDSFNSAIQEYLRD